MKVKLEEKNKIISEQKEKIDILELKINKLEKLLVLKTQKLKELQEELGIEENKY